ncbi:MAG: DNA topoisomerase 3 [Opitutaceae bacterium]|nr:DNA topoisomerase 3 [Opitutaceae bacterium]
MKSLIIAEKPSVAADIARALGRVPKKTDHYENDEYVVSSAVGHLVELQMPEHIDKKKYGFWRLETLPIIPEKFELRPIDESKKHFDMLKRLLARKDVGLVINACDAGREGELIFTYIYQLAKCQKPVKRLWMSSMTREGILEAFAHLRNNEQMNGLADAARCRSESDWLIGINGTRAITKRMFGSRAGNVASVGRVQTPTLGIVYARELEIRNFKPRGYWRVTASFDVANGRYEGVYQRPDFKKSGDEHDRVDRLWEKAPAEAVLAACRGHPPAEVSEEKKPTTQISPRLYDLTTLQREANTRYGFPARRTLQIAQALYERHKMITYPRTDSRALPEDYLPTVRQTLASLHGSLAPHAQKALDEGWVQFSKRIFNNSKVSDHFAIIPTEHEDKHLDEAEAKIYDMIARRFVAVFYPAAEFDVTTRLSVVAGHTFRTEGKVLTSPGWLAVYGKTAVEDDAPGSTALPALSADDGKPARGRTVEPVLHEEATRPPPRYTEATLLSAMEGAGKLVDDEDHADAMKERGLGTPATRADIIDGLIHQKYMERLQRDLAPTAKAEQLFQFLAAVKTENLTSPAMTGEWEYKLRQMEHGKFSRKEFMREIIVETRGIVNRVKTFEEDDSVARVTDIPSPTDGKPLRETLRGYKSQDGEFMVYKVIGGRKIEEAEVRDLVTNGIVGPLDGFVSNKTRNRFAASLRLVKDEETGKWKTELDFGDKADIDTLTPFWTDPRTGAELCEAGNNFVLREREGGVWKQTFRVGRIMCQKPLTREHAIQLIEKGKTDLIQGFISKKGRPFDAFLKKEDGRIAWEFPPRKPRVGKDGKPIPRKTKAPPDISKAVSIGESKLLGGEILQTDDAFYVRKPGQDGRIVFTMKRQLCQKELPVDEIKRLLDDGRTNLIEGFVSKRGAHFSAFLVLAPNRAKVEFEFPPR